MFRVVRDAGQSPYPAYDMGMTRLSCVVCIVASRSDLRTAALLQAVLYRRYAELEERNRHTLSPSSDPFLALAGIPVRLARRLCSVDPITPIRA